MLQHKPGKLERWLQIHYPEVYKEFCKWDREQAWLELDKGNKVLLTGIKKQHEQNYTIRETTYDNNGGIIRQEFKAWEPEPVKEPEKLKAIDPDVFLQMRDLAEEPTR